MESRFSARRMLGGAAPLVDKMRQARAAAVLAQGGDPTASDKNPSHFQTIDVDLPKQTDYAGRLILTHRETMNFVATLLTGLQFVPKIGEPGPVVFSGLNAFCVVSNPDNKCAVGAAEYGYGRVVAMGHNGFMGAATKNADIAILNRNAVAWAARSERLFLEDSDTCTDPSWLANYPREGCKTQTVKVAGIGFTSAALSQYVDALNKLQSKKIFALGASANQATADNVRTVLASNPDVVAWTNSNANVEVADADDIRVTLLTQFVKSGGGLVTAVCPWGWESLAKNAKIGNRFLFNHVIGEAGLEYSGGTAGVSTGKYSVADCIARSQKTPPAQSLQTCASQLSSGAAELKTEELEAALNFYRDLPGRAVRSPAFEDPVEPIARNEGALVCKFPLQAGLASDKTQRAQATAIMHMLWLKKKSDNTQPKELMSLGTSTADFPGTLRGASSERLRGFRVSINPTLARWQSLNVYAPPGETVSITISDQAVAAYPGLTFDVRIGCHQDQLPYFNNNVKYSLQRHGVITTSRQWQPQMGKLNPDNEPFSQSSIAAQETTILIGSVYGGPVYITMSEKKSPEQATTPIVFSIDGGVAMPVYNIQREMGETNWSELTDSYPYTSMSWQDKLATFNQAPWGELEGRYIAMVVPYDALMKVTDPKAAIEFWDAVVAHYLALSGQTIDGKERVVADRQISAGYMHSGYPIMTHMDIYSMTKGATVPPILDVYKNRVEPPWGLYHELGHNRQQSAWTWGGLTEVTVNIFSLYATQMMNHISPYKAPYYVRNCRDNAVKYLQSPTSTYQEWRSAINTALAMYVVLIEEFGWKNMADTFRYYKTDKSKPTLNTDEDKAVYWCKVTSLMAHTDLRNFYRQWKWTFVDSHSMPELDPLPKYTKNVAQLILAN